MKILKYLATITMSLTLFLLLLYPTCFLVIFTAYTFSGKSWFKAGCIEGVSKAAHSINSPLNIAELNKECVNSVYKIKNEKK